MGLDRLDRPAAGCPRVGADADTVYDAFAGWVEGQGLALYPHQDEAVLELLAGNNVILATPTGSGKSMVAVGGARRRPGRATGSASTPRRSRRW